MVNDDSKSRPKQNQIVLIHRALYKN